MAILTKGTYGFLVSVIMFIWLAYDKPNGLKLRELFSVKALFFTLPIALSWYVLIFMQHGETALTQFAGDQFTTRVHNITIQTTIWHYINYIIQLLRNFIPWSIFIIFGIFFNKKGNINFIKKYRYFIRMTLFLLFISILIFSIGNISRSRYLFPLYPIISIVISGMLYCVFKKITYNKSYIILAMAIFVFFGIVIVNSMILTKDEITPARNITGQLIKRNIRGRNIAIITNPIVLDLSSHIRLLSNGRINPVIIPADNQLTSTNFLAIILPSQDTNNIIDKKKFNIIPTGYYKKHKSKIDFFIAIQK